MKSIFVVFLMLIACSASAEKKEEIIYEQLIEKTMRSAIDAIHSNTDENIEEAVEFLEVINFDESFGRLKVYGTASIKKHLSKEEIDYLSSQVSHPVFKKYNRLASELRSHIEARDKLSKEELSVIDNRNWDIERGMAQGLNNIASEMKDTLASIIISQLVEKKDLIGTKEEIAQVCEGAFEREIYNSSFFVCGVGYKTGSAKASRIFAKHYWTGSFVSQDIEKSISIYKEILLKRYDSESAFYYGALVYNTANNEADKKLGACWIKSSAVNGFDKAIAFGKEVSEKYSDVEIDCELF
ncbi:hypothetical protein [Microbulbifer sp. ZKSA002]|uniref:hypothetical protein n=1 Tax=Microbulbifer sp. ZKSA002 TaxID=3243388 RepID=UPI0040391DF3